MALRRYYRTLVAVVSGLFAAAAALVAGEQMSPIDGLFYDLSLAATTRRAGTSGEPVAVIALDHDSLGAEELARYPRVLMAPVWAKLINAVIDGGVKAVGFDLIFAYSANRLPGFDPQYDQPFLKALTRGRDRVVLGRSAGSGPALPFAAAALDGGADLDLIPDRDGVDRAVESGLENAGRRPLPALSAALLDRAKAPAMPRRVLLAPAAALEAIPTYRLIDVLRCADRDPAALRSVLANKIVVVGTNLPEEDRKRTLDRFMARAGERPMTIGGCRLDRLGASAPRSGTTPGIFLHAAAVKAVVNGSLMRPAPVIGRVAAAAVSGVAGSLPGLLLSPWVAALCIVAFAGLAFGLALVLLGYGLWLPLAVPLGALVVSVIFAYIVRFLIEERRRRRVQRAFRHYLAPAVVDRLVEGDAELRLGGELREVTIMFADFTGFTAMSGRLDPAALMTLTNAYLGLVVEAVEATGGYIVDYVGDAAMAIWGAPLDDPEHAEHAAKAALDAHAAVSRAKAAADARGELGFVVKIGINTGPAVVGNVGAPGRYSYKAVGETVNIGARLEGLSEDYGCPIVVGRQTAATIADRFVLSELDWTKVKGKAEAIVVYELLAERAGAGPPILAYPDQYQTALGLYRQGKFAEAEACWRARVDHPTLCEFSPPKAMAERAAALRANPPADWDGVYVRGVK